MKTVSLGLRFFLVAFCFMFCIHSSFADVQRKPLAAVDIDEFTKQMQVVVTDTSTMTQAWWIPAEFWGAAFHRTNPAFAEQALGQLKGYGILAVIQADTTPFASLIFHKRDSVEKRLSVSYRNYSIAPISISQAKELPGSVQMLIDVLSPMFANTMGDLGKNMHLFVMNNELNGKRIIDPYQEGTVLVELAASKTTPSRNIAIEFPVDALFEPRYCPNGKPAHISWKFCPWSGKKL